MKIGDELIVSALFLYPTNEQAAQAVGISERQLYERMKKPRFQAIFANARARVFDQSLSAVQRALSASVDTMIEIMGNPENSPQTRLNAAESLQRAAIRLVDAAENEKNARVAAKLAVQMGIDF